MERILSSYEVRNLIGRVMSVEKIRSLPSSEYVSLSQSVQVFLSRFEKAYQQFGQDVSGELTYRDIILYYGENVLSKIRKYLSVDGPDRKAARAIEFMLHPSYMDMNARSFLSSRWRKFRRIDSLEEVECPEFDRPIFIVSAPRAGSTLLFETLSKFDEIWSIGKENHDIENDIPNMHPSAHNYCSNRLTDATPDIAEKVKMWFTSRLRDNNRNFYVKGGREQHTIRFLEKTPKNALRIPFLKKIFPGAFFIFLYRDPLENISSILEGWRSNYFLAYRNMPRWPYKEWHFLLPQGWESLVDCPLAEIAAYQWQQANQTIVNDLKNLDNDDWCLITYNNLIKRPEEVVSKIIRFADIQENQETQQLLVGVLPLSRMVVSMPSPDKWRKNEEEITPYLRKALSVANQVTTLTSEKDTL